jgi:hypothetical protein
MFITFPKTEFWIFTRGRFFVKLVVNDSCILLLLHELKIVERKKKIKNQNFELNIRIKEYGHGSLFRVLAIKKIIAEKHFHSHSFLI